MADIMEYRSTNRVGYTHFGGDVVCGVNNAVGWQIGNESTANAAGITVVADASTAAGFIAQKGAAQLLIGSTDAGAVLNFKASTFLLGSTGAVVQIGSTAPFNGFLRVAVANCTTFNFASTDAGVSGETTVTVTGVNSSHFVTANIVTGPTAVTLAHAYPVASTAASVHLVWIKGSTVAVGNSTANVRFLVHRFAS